MDNWYQIPKKESLNFEEKSFKTSLLLNKFTCSLLRSMDGIVVNTEQFEMFQLQYSVLVTNDDLKKFLLDNKFITFLKNAGLIEHVKKKETPYKDKSSRLNYYKGMYFTATDKARMLLEKMKVYLK
jgi:NifB/MoaA-like Fe-S oxidoreductase